MNMMSLVIVRPRLTIAFLRLSGISAVDVLSHEIYNHHPLSFFDIGQITLQSACLSGELLLFFRICEQPPAIKNRHASVAVHPDRNSHTVPIIDIINAFLVGIINPEAVGDKGDGYRIGVLNLRINHLQRVDLTDLNLSREIGSEVGNFFLIA